MTGGKTASLGLNGKMWQNQWMTQKIIKNTSEYEGHKKFPVSLLILY